MNGTLQKSLGNPWLASLLSFMPIIALLFCLFICSPKPLPTLAGIQNMPWWAPLGGLAGAGAVVAGLMFVNTVGAGAFAAPLKQDGVKGSETLQKKTGDAEVTLAVGDRFLVTVAGTHQKDLTLVESVAERMDLAKLTKL